MCSAEARTCKLCGLLRLLRHPLLRRRDDAPLSRRWQEKKTHRPVSGRHGAGTRHSRLALGTSRTFSHSQAEEDAYAISSAMLLQIRSDSSNLHSGRGHRAFANLTQAALGSARGHCTRVLPLYARSRPQAQLAGLPGPGKLFTRRGHHRSSGRAGFVALCIEGRVQPGVLG